MLGAVGRGVGRGEHGPQQEWAWTGPGHLHVLGDRGWTAPECRWLDPETVVSTEPQPAVRCGGAHGEEWGRAGQRCWVGLAGCPCGHVGTVSELSATGLDVGPPGGSEALRPAATPRRGGWRGAGAALGSVVPQAAPGFSLVFTFGYKLRALKGSGHLLSQASHHPGPEPSSQSCSKGSRGLLRAGGGEARVGEAPCLCARERWLSPPYLCILRLRTSNIHTCLGLCGDHGLAVQPQLLGRAAPSTPVPGSPFPSPLRAGVWGR